MTPEFFDRPYVISWNLTYRCNLACEHCYLDAGGRPKVQTENFLDRSELSTEGCFRVIDEIVSFAPECVTILTGGEPLLRHDILEIIRYGQGQGLWMVVGTNGVRISVHLARLLKKEGVRGLALSLDALEPRAHDRFRMIRGAWQNTVEGAAILRDCDLPFVVQTTVGRHNLEELEGIAHFAHEKMAARVWNLYFLVPTGRGQFSSELTQEEYDDVLARLFAIQKSFHSKMLVNAKCAPHYVRTLLEREPDSPFLKTFVGGSGGCPAGAQYLGIRPNGDVTPCPYLPVFGGNLLQESLSQIWKESELFVAMRDREQLGGRCGRCELKALCGGCRARAFGITGDFEEEDPLCSFQPGSLVEAVSRISPPLEYGHPVVETIRWDEAARTRIESVPAFVRGMVVKRVEEYCRQKGAEVVTVEELQEIRSRMPVGKLFRRSRPS